jgi:PAS domain S-box-containing protein
MTTRSRVLVVDANADRANATADALATPTDGSQGVPTDDDTATATDDDPSTSSDDDPSTPTADADEPGARTVTVAASVEAALSAIGDESFDCVVCERTVGSHSAVDVLETIRSVHGDLPVVLCTADGDEALAEALVARDVDEYVPRTDGWQARLDAAVRRCMDNHRDRTGRLKERALDEAPVGITIADAEEPDVPLIYANDAFTDLTGYDREAVIGRNCRFLQGPDSDADAVREMREGIADREPVRTEIKNYTADGDAFWNRVDIAPVSDGTGDVTHFVGFQTDVTERVEAERVAERRADELAAERESLAHVLDRVDGLVTDTGQALVEASTRADIEHALCSLVVEHDPYTAAWIGDPDLATGSITPNAIAGGDVGDEPLDLAPGSNPIATAIDTGTVQVVDAADLPPWHREHVTESFATLAAIPLSYRDARYGVLCVYGDDASAFDDRETRILTALGRLVATAISAVETRRTLTADDVVTLTFAVRNRDAFFVALADRADVALRFTGSMRPDDDRLHVGFTADTDDVDALVAAADAIEDIESVTVITATESGCVIEVAVADRGFLSTLTDYGAAIREIAASPGEASVTVELPRDANARSLVDRVESTYADVELAAYRDGERADASTQGFIAAVENELTDRQLTALRRAYYGEFFEWPRPTSGDDLAESMGIARSTFHQHLRAAERKLVGAFFEHP